MFPINNVLVVCLTGLIALAIVVFAVCHVFTSQQSAAVHEVRDIINNYFGWFRAIVDLCKSHLTIADKGINALLGSDRIYTRCLGGLIYFVLLLLPYIAIVSFLCFLLWYCAQTLMLRLKKDTKSIHAEGLDAGRLKLETPAAMTDSEFGQDLHQKYMLETGEGVAFGTFDCVRDFLWKHDRVLAGRSRVSVRASDTE